MSIQFAQPDTAETRLAQTFYVVEATDTERFMLWCEHSSRTMHPPWDVRNNRRANEPVEWEESMGGWGVHVGDDNKRPVYISVSWARLNGQLVCFWYPTSRIINITKCEAWIDAHFTKPGARCNAMNFNHCLHAIEEANKVAP